LLKVGQKIDRYVMDSVIGTGGTAIVYRVKHQSLGTFHALKVLSVVSEVIRERMLQEGKVQATLRHPNVVVVSDVLEVNGQPGLLMEYIAGPSLQKAMREFKLPLEAAELLFVGMVNGVKAAHDMGIIHRDMKPANVLLKKTDEGFVPKVTDFGLAKLIIEGGEDSGRNKTRAGVAMGTPAYMAAEQIRDASNVDKRADIFSMGCILYELTVGQRAFPGDDAIRIYNSIMSGDYTPPLELKPDLPPRIDEAIRGALTMDRDKRIPDCDTLLSVLKGERTWEVTDDEQPFEEDPPTIETARPANPNAPEMVVALASKSDATTSHGDDDDVGRVVAKLQNYRNVDDTILQDGVQPELDPLYGPIGNSIVPRESDMDTIVEGDHIPPTAEMEVVQQGSMGIVSWAIIAVLMFGVLSFAGGGILVTYVTQVVGGGPPVQADSEMPTVETPVRPPPAETPPHDAPPTVVETPADDPPDDPPVQKKAHPPDPIPAPVHPTKVPIPDAGTTIRRPPPPSGPVTAKILSKPPTAKVTIDGIDKGRTPAKLELKPGKHKVEVRSSDKVGSFDIVVVRGGTNKWCFAFDYSEMHKGSCP